MSSYSHLDEKYTQVHTHTHPHTHTHTFSLVYRKIIHALFDRSSKQANAVSNMYLECNVGDK